LVAIRCGDSLPSLAFNALESWVIEGPVPALVELLKSEPELLAQLMELIALFQEAERFANHLAGRGVASRADALGDDFFQFRG
jgi:hypothetical protein